MVEDRLAATSDNIVRQVEFMQANDYLKKRRLQEKNTEAEMRHNEKIEYFPFTAGDLVQRQRAEMAEIRKDEMNALNSAKNE